MKSFYCEKFVALVLISFCLVFGTDACNSRSVYIPTEKQIGPNGGTITGTDGLSMTFPAGALDKEVLIRITDTGQHPESAASTIYKFEPEGLEFKKAVSISIPTTATLADNPVLYWSVLNDDSTFEQIVGALSGKSYNAEIWHFSIGYIHIRGIIPMDGGTDAGVDAGMDGGTDAGVPDGGETDGGTDGGGGVALQNVVSLAITFDNQGVTNTWDFISSLTATTSDGGVSALYTYVKNDEQNSTISFAMDGGWDSGVVDVIDMNWTGYSSGQCGLSCVFSVGRSSAYCLTSQCFAVPPTGQNKCYDNSGELDGDGGCPSITDRDAGFWGQDAMFQKVRVFICDGGPCNPDAGIEGEVVTDSVTGFMWQRTFVSGMYWEDALDYCKLGYGTYQDWRLPNPFELASIVDSQQSNPAIDQTIFPGTPGSWPSLFWASPSRVDGNIKAWCVLFEEGTTAYFHKLYWDENVRCVSLGPTVAIIDGRFIVTGLVPGEPVLADTITDLMWEGSFGADMDWQTALSYCATRNYGGFTDWRLPNRNELMSLVNYSRSSPASDFPDMTSDYYWSSTSYVSDASMAWRVHFSEGGVYPEGKGDTLYALCVRP